MAGENDNTQVKETTTDFDSYMKARGGDAPPPEPARESLDDLQKDREQKAGRQRDDKGRFTSEKGERGPGPHDTGEPGADGRTNQGETDDAGGKDMGWLKKRVERERRKTKAKDKEIAELKAQLAAKGDSAPASQAAQAELQPPEQPNRDDFENYDAFIEAMVDYWEAEDLYKENQNARVSQKADEGQEEKVDEKVEVDEQKADEKAEVLDEPTDFDDLLEILDEHPESDNFYEDFRIGVEEGKIQLPESVVDWLLLNEEKAANVVRAFIDKPRLSRNVSRQVGARQEQTLNKIASSYEPGQSGGDDNPAIDPSLSDFRGRSRTPERPIEDVNNFDDYKARRTERGALGNTPFGYD